MYKNIDADVIIIGAGIAGLTAAYTLLDKEPTLNVLILEATDKVGGRIFNGFLKVKDGTEVAHYDLGAQWLCKNQTKLIHLLEKLQIDLVPKDETQKVIVDYYKKFSLSNLNKFFNFLNTFDVYDLKKFIFLMDQLSIKINAKDESLIKLLSNVTLKNFLDKSVKNKATKKVMEYLVLMHCGVGVEEISALFYVFFCMSTRGIEHQFASHGLHELRPKNGAFDICQKLIQTKIGYQNIMRQELVTCISTRNNWVEVTTEKNEFCCHNVIVTVPPKDLLKIKFTPFSPLEKSKALTSSVSRPVIIFVITYRTAFWREQGFSGNCYALKNISNGPIVFCYDITSDNKPALVGQIVETSTTKKLKNNLGYKDQVLDQLYEYFGLQVFECVDYLEKEWSGGVMYGWNVGLTNYIEIMQTPQNRIFWAGAETTQEWYGTMAGAVSSGIRAALEVLYDLRPALLTVDDMVILSPIRKKSSFQRHYDPVYSRAVNWYIYLPLGLLVLFALYKLRNKYL